MKVALNTMVKNEEVILSHVLPIWLKYPVDYFIFYNDNSSDKTIEIIEKFLPKDKIVIINDNLISFNEGYQRQKMIDKSRELKVDYVICLDADELLSSNIVQNFEDFLKIYNNVDLNLFWYNIVNNSLGEYRSDPLYENNFRSFVLPMKHTGNLDISLSNYHTPRTPNVNLPKIYTKEYGVIHLQSSNVKYYALKQLWYKHYEFKYYGYNADSINKKYDVVINNLNFNPKKTDYSLIEGIDIDLSFFENLAETKGYLSFIKENYNSSLVTFGEKYI